MRIGIVSDTHDHVDNARKAVQIFKAEEVSYVFHAGDFVNPLSASLWKGLNLVGVLGNNDGEKLGLAKTVADIGGELHEHVAEMELDGLAVAMYHGTSPALTAALIRCGKYDLVISGHTHILDVREEGRTTVINPGTAHGFGKQATIVLFDTQTKETTVKEL